jgi:hypothetical protein
MNPAYRQWQVQKVTALHGALVLEYLVAFGAYLEPVTVGNQ